MIVTTCAGPVSVHTGSGLVLDLSPLEFGETLRDRGRELKPPVMGHPNAGAVQPEYVTQSFHEVLQDGVDVIRAEQLGAEL